MIKRSDKRGSEKYYIIISMILGIMILALSLYFIFNEYFTEESLDLEACRQSIILRNTIPDVEAKAKTFQIKDKFPLKCKNEVINIDYKDVSKAEKEIADQFVSSWYLLGNGRYYLYPSATWSIGSYCFVSSRIHFSAEAKEYYIKNGKEDNRISIKRALMKKMDSGGSYFEYLKNSGGETAFGAGYFEYEWAEEGKGFEIDIEKKKHWALDPRADRAYYIYPDYLEMNKGDFYILISSLVFSKDIVRNNLLFFQDLNGENFNQLSKKDAADFVGYLDAKTCDSFETIPA